MTSLTPKALVVQDLGLLEYETALELQRKTVQKVKVGEPDHLFLLEHPSVYTLGRKGQRLGALETAGVSLVAVERGGEATFHNPGQLVCYPILKLEAAERDVNRYLRNLEEALISVLAHYGLEGESRPEATGVWLVGQNKKIASIGVALTGWVTYHGIALNVCNDLTGFSRIQPCGFSASVMTSLQEQLGGRAPRMGEVKSLWVKTFCEIFNREV